MATIVSEDGCSNNVTSASEEPLPSPNTLAPPKLRSEDSISLRRDRSLTTFLFQEIVGEKLKCYEKWKLWLLLFILMTVIAVTAITIATVFAVKYTSYKSKTEAVDAQHNLLYEITHEDAGNFSDHTDETQKIFNTFDDDDDGVWNMDEFSNHYLLSSGVKTVFNGIDTNNDDILSYQEIVLSLSKYDLSSSYIASVQQMYNYTFPNTSDPSDDALLNSYAANIYLASFDIEEFGFITREYFNDFRSNTMFKHTDIDNDNFISFDEFLHKVGDSRTIQFLRKYDFENVLESLNESYFDPNYNISTSVEVDMCPATFNTNAYGHRRLGDLFIDNHGQLVYIYTNGPCEATLICDNMEDDSRSGGGWNSWEDCNPKEIDMTVTCMIQVIDDFLSRKYVIADCWNRMAECLDMADFWDCFPFCHCTCSDGCLADLFDFERRRLGNSGCNGASGCACGADCKCFSGKSEMLIKRDDQIQNVLLKDMKIGDYAQTKWGKWSKVWFIKNDLGDFEFLKLYFGENEYIEMTGDHLLYFDEISDDKMKRADEMRIGDEIFVMNYNNDLNSSSFIKKEIVFIESVVSSDGAYSPVTMDGSVVVSNVLSSCYAQSPEMAQSYHDSAGIFRWISTYNTNLAAVITSFFYDILFMELRKKYGLEVAFSVFNVYSTPCIVLVTGTVLLFGIIRSVSYFF